MNGTHCRLVLFCICICIPDITIAITRLSTIIQAAPFPVDEFQIALAPVQNPPLGEDAFDLSTIHGALPLVCQRLCNVCRLPTDRLQGFSSRYIYDFNEMNNALPGTPFLSSSRRSFKPYPLTPGSKTHAKVRQIRGDGLHQRRS